MFIKRWMNSLNYRFTMKILSCVSASEKDLGNILSTMIRYNFQQNISQRLYCVSSNNTGTCFEPHSLISNYCEVQEDFNNSSVSIDRKIKSITYEERCINKIKTVLKIPDIESIILYQKYPHLFHEAIGDTLSKITTLLDSGFNKKSIIKNIEILELNNDEITYKIKEVNSWGLNEDQKNDMTAFLKMELSSFNKVTILFCSERDSILEKNRIIYFSTVLRCSLEEMVNLSMKNEHLLKRNFVAIKEIFELLLGGEISPKYIRDNLYITAYSPQCINKWLKYSQGNVTDHKQIDNQIVLLQKLKEKSQGEKKILKSNQTREEFLAERLHVDIKVVKHLMLKNPKIFNQNLNHIKEIIEFLSSRGYTGTQICINPSVLNRDINFLKNRLKESHNLGCDKLPLSILCVSKSAYQMYLKKYF